MKHWIRSVLEVIRAGYPARKLIVIGVTGTDGKTTTCHLIYEMLKSAGIKVAMLSTVAGYIGGEEIDTGFHVTTPDATFLQPFIKRVVDAGMTHLVLEVTSHGLDQHRVMGCNIKIAVITNITHEHLDYHKSMANYRLAKAKILRGVRVAVLNKDDPSFAWLSSKVDRVTKIVSFTKWLDSRRSLALAGDYNRYNIAAAAAVAQILDARYQILKVIKNFAGVPGRMEEIKLGQNFRVIVDFAHTPNALEQVLFTLKQELGAKSQLIVVFGCAGLRDHSKRPLMGAIAVKYADRVIVTAEDPRTEKLDDIYKDIAAVGSLREDDRQKAINMAVKLAKKGDIVVITGKGHEKSMCFGTTEYPWSDQEAVKKAIKMLK
ncbi:UDP-N-acetylmuramoyl-L-alanyl-D-glutamate--2,6-diaminopimelate ligase [Candidatus Amesbacteria bacterium]|nr:UDP-N-acetylmuramoyl-L-alanyl-D-glutamate--2,6-diaminopimelate ligase [Candidatus Amesbacteria bacterium]